MYIRLLLDLICWATLIFMTHSAGYEKTTVVFSIIAVIVLALETTTIAQVNRAIKQIKLDNSQDM